MINAEEFVVKVRADTSAMNKATKNLNKQIEQLNKNTTSVGDTFTNIFRTKWTLDSSGIFDGFNKGIQKTEMYWKDMLFKMNEETAKFKGKTAKRLAASQINGYEYNLDKVKEKDVNAFDASGGGSLFTMYKNQYQGILDAYSWIAEKNSEIGRLTTTIEGNETTVGIRDNIAAEKSKIAELTAIDPNKNAAAIEEANKKIKDYENRLLELHATLGRLREEVKVTDQMMYKKYGNKWAKIQPDMSMGDQPRKRKEAEEFPVETLEKYKEKSKEATGIGARIKEDLSSVWKTFKKIFGQVLIWGTIRKIFQDISSTIQKGMQNAYQYSKQTKGVLSDVLDEWNSKKTALGNAVAAFWSNFTVAIRPYFTQILAWFVDIFNKMSKVVADIFNLPSYLTANVDIFAEWQASVKQTKQLISGLDELNFFDSNSNTEIADMFKTVDRTAADYKSTGEIIGNVCREVMAFFAGGFKAVKDWWLNTAWPNIKEWFKNLWPTIKGWFSNLGDIISKWWTGSITYVTDEDEYGNEYTRILDKEVGAWETIKNFFIELHTKLKNWFIGEDPDSGDTGVWQKKIEPKIKEWWNVFTNWMHDFFVSLFEYISEVILNKLTKPFNDWLAGRDTSVPIIMTQEEYDSKYGVTKGDGTVWGEVKAFFKNFFRNYAPTGTIVTNAKGGVYTKPTYGLVGEYAGANNNPEIISPRSLMLDTMGEANGQLVSTMVQCCRQLITAIDDKETDVIIGDETIARSAQRGQVKLNKLYGV